MKRIWLSMTLLAAAFNYSISAHDFDGHRDDDRSYGHRNDDHDDRGDQKLTIAVFGDWPYTKPLYDHSDLLINSINADRDVSLVIHVGDIHSGSMACTGAGYFPLTGAGNYFPAAGVYPTGPLSASTPVSTAAPDWNQQIFNRFQQIKKPVVYTPGDNEWTDCHKKKEFSSGAPLKELSSVRSLFFAKPGKTLGAERDVLTQAKYYDHAHPADAQFVENMMWDDGKVVFVTVNMPGSNNDTPLWTAPFADTTGQQTQERELRTAANVRWLQAAFRHAEDTGARAVVIAQQADMWDPLQLPVNGGTDGLDNYTGYVHTLANLVLHFGKPVLLLNGDSHIYEADHPLMPNNATNGYNTFQIHNTQPVPNLTRITVQGADTAPAEWVRLTIDTSKKNPFSWSNVTYCALPGTSCP